MDGEVLRLEQWAVRLGVKPLVIYDLLDTCLDETQVLLLAQRISRSPT
jgi:hypothetical protein